VTAEQISNACIDSKTMGCVMATLVIRDLDDEVKARLRVQAAEHGRSMEAEARAILAAAVRGRRPPRQLGSRIRDQFADLGGVDLDVRLDPNLPAPPTSTPNQTGDRPRYQRRIQPDATHSRSARPRLGR
jgi:plasmid stability protein